jgi:hypothetical protein
VYLNFKSNPNENTILRLSSKHSISIERIKSLIKQKEFEENLNIPEEHKNYIKSMESSIFISNSISEVVNPKVESKKRPYFIAIPENFSGANIQREMPSIKQDNYESDTKSIEGSRKGWIFIDFEMQKKRYNVKSMWIKEKFQSSKPAESFSNKYAIIAKRVFERMRKLPTRPL